MESELSLVCKTTTTFENGVSSSRTMEGYVAFPHNTQPPRFLTYSPLHKKYIESEEPLTSIARDLLSKENNPFSNFYQQHPTPLITHNTDQLNFSSPIECKIKLCANSNPKKSFPLVADPDEATNFITIRDKEEYQLSIETKSHREDMEIVESKLTLFEQDEKISYNNNNNNNTNNCTKEKVNIASGTQVLSLQKIDLGQFELVHQIHSYSPFIEEDDGIGLFGSSCNFFAIPNQKFRFVAQNRVNNIEGVESDVKLEWNRERESWIGFFSLTNFTPYSLWVKKLKYSSSDSNLKVKPINKMLNPFDCVPSSIIFSIDFKDNHPQVTPNVLFEWVHAVIPKEIQYYHFGVHKFSLPSIDTIAVQTIITSPFIKGKCIEFSDSAVVNIELSNRGSTGVVVSSIYTFFDSSLLKVLPNSNSSVKILSRDFGEVVTLLPSKMELLSGETKTVSVLISSINPQANSNSSLSFETVVFWALDKSETKRMVTLSPVTYEVKAKPLPTNTNSSKTTSHTEKRKTPTTRNEKLNVKRMKEE